MAQPTKRRLLIGRGGLVCRCHHVYLPQIKAAIEDAPACALAHVKSQTQAGLQLASGAAENEIPAEVGGFKVPDLVDAFDPADVLELIDVDRAPERLAQLMALAAAADIDVRAFNAALRDAGVGMAIERRNRKD